MYIYFLFVLLVIIICYCFITKRNIENFLLKFLNYIFILKYRLAIISSQIGWKGIVLFCFRFIRDKIYICFGGKTSCIEVKDKFYILTYHYGMRTYKIKWKAKLGPDRIFMIQNENNEDVTETVKSYLGPGEQFHGILLSPIELGFKKLKFKNVFGETKCFQNKQLMILT